MLPIQYKESLTRGNMPSNDKYLSKHNTTVQPLGMYLAWDEIGMAVMQTMLMSMTEEERKQFGIYTMAYAHLEIFPDVYWNPDKNIVQIVAQGKSYFRYGEIIMYLTEGNQQHFDFDKE